MERKELIAGLLNRIGILTTKTFNERLAAQKIIFIAQQKMNGFPLKYRYGLYVSGPYSPQLTKDFYDIGDTSKYGRVKFKDPDLDRRYEEYATLIKSYLNDRAVLELMGTLVYLEKRGYNGDELKNKLNAVKPGFNNQQYTAAYTLYEQINRIFN